MSKNTGNITTFNKNYANGAKDLKDRIQEFARSAQGIRDEFSQGLQGPKAIVERKCRTNGSHDFKAHMATVAHRSFVYTHEKLPQSSKYLQAEMEVMGILEQLEDFRKMAVNNKQQKKTTISMIKKMKGGGGKKNPKKITSSEEGDDAAAMTTDTFPEPQASSCCTCCELEYEGPSTAGLKMLIETIKQNHRTVSRNLLKQSNKIIMMLRGRILAFKLAAEDTIGEIIHHADKCRAFIDQLHRLDLIEHCANAWWFETQKDAMDHSEHFVSVVAVDEPRDFDASVPHPPHSAFPNSPLPMLKICVHGISTTMGQENLIAEYVLDQELAETILTEEAVQSFEHEKRQQMSCNQQNHDEVPEQQEEPTMSSWAAEVVWGCTTE